MLPGLAERMAEGQKCLFQEYLVQEYFYTYHVACLAGKIVYFAAFEECRIGAY